MGDDDWGDLEDNDNDNKKKPSGLLGIGLELKNNNQMDSSTDKKKRQNNLFLGGGSKDDDLDDVDNFLGGNEDKFN